MRYSHTFGTRLASDFLASVARDLKPASERRDLFSCIWPPMGLRRNKITYTLTQAKT